MLNEPGDTGIVIGLLFFSIFIFVFIAIYYEEKKKKESQRKREIAEATKAFEESILKTKFLERNVISTIKSSKTDGGSLGRAVAGGIIAGPVGAVVGAGTGKKRTVYDTSNRAETTFMVYFKDGTKTLSTVEDYSDMYFTYLHKLEASEDD